MGQFWKKNGQAKQHRPEDQSDCVERAHELHAFWCSKGSFPIFWSLIDNDKEKLASIFLFFCEMQALLRTTAANSVVDHLENRLLARWTRGAAPIPSDLNDEIKSLSQAQIAAFEKLEKKELISSAFELFVSGSLTVTREQYMTKKISESVVERDSRGEFEPDGAAFFFWAEFAFVASYSGFESDTWKQILPVLLRSERIFAICYGQPENGMIPPDRKYEDYGIIQEFTRLHPREARRVELTASTRFDELEAEATACARFAFPGEF